MTSEQLIDKVNKEAMRFNKTHSVSPQLKSAIFGAMMRGALIALELSREDDREILRSLNAGLSRKD